MSIRPRNTLTFSRLNPNPLPLMPNTTNPTGVATAINPLDFSWTANLYEVGSPIRTQAREIAWLKEQADKRLEAAQEAHAQSMADLQISAGSLNRQISSLWTPEEIAAAKSGVMLANGMECQL